MNTFVTDFLGAFKAYVIEIAPALAIGFFLSGLLHEFLPPEWIDRHLGGKGLKGILYATLVGVIMPVCCWGSLPLAITFYMRGAALGPVLALLVATPATSINALIVTGRFFGLGFAAFLFFAVIVMGLVVGVIGNMLNIEPRMTGTFLGRRRACPADEDHAPHQGFAARMKAVLQFAYVDMPREIGLETLIGLALASAVSVLAPLGTFVRGYLVGSGGYVFSLAVGLVTYMCSTMGVPLVDAFVRQGLGIGPALVLLLVGPITSYATILVLRKEFGTKLLLVYLCSICGISVLLGIGFSLL